MSAISESSRAPSGDAVRPWWLGPVPFSVTLATSVGLLVLVAVSAVLAIEWWTNRKNTLQLLNEKAELIVDRIEVDLRDHLDPAVEQSEFIARQIESGAIDLADKARLADLLTGALASTHQISAIVTWDTDLKQFGARRDHGRKTQIIEGDRSSDPLLRRIADELASAKGPDWGEVVAPNEVALINLRRPLRRDGRLIGFLINVISVPELSELVSHTGDLFESTAFVLYGRDRVLAHPFLVSPHADQSPENPVVGLKSVGDIVLANLWEGTPVPGFEAAAADNVNVVKISLGGQDYISIYKWVTDYGDVPLGVGAWFPVSDLDEELKRLQWAGLAGVLMLIAAILAAVLLGKLIARPISRVAASASRVGNLDLAHVDPLPPSRIKELNDQARAFNAMLAGLRSFETYVPRSLVKRLIRKDGSHSVVSAERELTVMFTDIVGFTTLSERLPAAAVADFLNEHLGLLGSCIEAEGGTVDKFIGDALMAFWGAPEAQSDTAVRASRAALAIARAVEADNATRQTEGRRAVHVRIGLHTGPVVVGNIGWPGRINYTIVGDTVNTCQRLEAMGKQLDRGEAVTILMSGMTAQRLDQSFVVEPAGTFPMKGKSEEVDVFRLVGRRNGIAKWERP